MGKTKKIGNLEFRFSKERGLEWRMGEGETHRWKPKLPFGPKSGGEDSYDDGYDGRGYDDRGYDDREYDDRGYDDRGYDDRGYDDRGYDDRGYEGGRYGSRGYDDRGYDDYAAYDQEGGGEYDRSRYGSEEFEQQEENVILRYLYENEWLMWVLLVVLPPLGIWILWKRDRFDIMVRSIISAVSAIWFIIALVWMFGGFRGGNDVTTGPNAGGTINLVQPSALPSASAAVSGASGTPILSATPTPSPSASAGTNTSNTGSTSTPRPNNNSGTTTTTDPNQNAVVYANASGRYYHLHSTCPEMNMTTPGTPMSVASAEQQGKVACPVCITGTGNDGDTSTVYYYHDDGQYYHLNSTCDGRISEAPAHSYTETMSSGKDPCPNCVGLWATPGGKHFHTNPNCDGMTGARLYTRAEATELNKTNPHTLCPICAGGVVKSTITSLTDRVYMTETGEWFHTQSNCQGMKNAKSFTAEEARYLYNRDPCPYCVEIDFSNVTVETNPSTVLHDNSSVVLATKGEQYYHIRKDCPQFGSSRNSVMVTAKFCLEQNMAPCPMCISGATVPSPSAGATYNPNVEDVYSPESVRWYSSKSDRYFHVDENCQNATGNLSAATPSVINSRDQSPCPLCIGVKTTDNVYARSDEPYFHTDRNCSRANNCYNVSLFRALANGKKPCPDCILAANNPSVTPAPSTGGDDEYVYLDMEGVYHARSSCGAVASSTRRWALSEAIDRFEPCSVCNPPTELGGNDGNGGSSGGDGTTYVYIATETIAHNGYYHRRSSCSDAGMSSDNSQRVTLDWALRFDYEPCPRCNPPTE